MSAAACSTKKEITSYEKEADQQAEKISKMEAAGADSHDIRKQVRSLPQYSGLASASQAAVVQTEVLSETVQMIDDSNRRFAGAVENLRAFIVRFDSSHWLEQCYSVCARAPVREAIPRLHARAGRSRFQGGCGGHPAAG